MKSLFGNVVRVEKKTDSLITVRFAIDNHLQYKDKTTGKENKITIKSDSGLTKEEIERMVQDAEVNAESDKKLRELIETRNNAESTLNEFQSDIDKYKDQVTAEEKANVEDGAQAIRDAIKGDDVKIIQDSIPKLYEAMGPITTKKTKEEEAVKKAEEQAKKDGVNIPGYSGPNSELQDILSKINKETTVAELKVEIEKLEKDVIDLQTQHFGSDGDYFQKRQELVKPIQDRVFTAMKKVAKREGYSFVFDKANQSNLVYAEKEFDMSNSVLEEMGITK